MNSRSILPALVLALGLVAHAQAETAERGGLCATGGPDASGYTYCDSGDPVGPGFEFTDISGTGTPILLDDDGEQSEALGFSFDFYGTTYTSVIVADNGILSFTPGAGAEFDNDCPLQAGSPADSMFAFWDDLDPSADGAAVYVQSFGTCPYTAAVGASGACFIAQWHEFDYWPGDGKPGGSAGTFQAILFEDGTIVFQYDKALESLSGSPTVAISADGAANSLLYDCVDGGGGKTPVMAGGPIGIDVAGSAVQFAPAGVPEADLSVTKVDSADPVAAGSPLTWTITVDNLGPDAADNVVVSDTLPAGVTLVSTSGCAEDPNGVPTCTLGNIAASGSAAYDITVDIDLLFAGTLDNTATASTTTDDPVPGNDSDTETTTVTGAASDLALTLTDTAVPPIMTGDSFDIVMDVFNGGPQGNANVVVNGALSDGLMFVASGCATGIGGSVSWNAGALASGASVSCAFTVEAGNSAGLETYTATASGDVADPAPANNTDIQRLFGIRLVAVPTLGVPGLIALGLVLLVLAGRQARNRRAMAR